MILSEGGTKGPRKSRRAPRKVKHTQWRIDYQQFVDVTKYRLEKVQRSVSATAGEFHNMPTLECPQVLLMCVRAYE